MGKRYTKQEIGQIQALTEQGLTIKQIAEALGRPKAGIRNIRHRTKLKAETRESIESLKHERRTLNDKVQELRWELSTLQTRKEQVSKALNIEEQALYQKLYNALNQMKDQKPELFHISVEEQIAKITVQLAGSFLKWLISEKKMTYARALVLRFALR